MPNLSNSAKFATESINNGTAATVKHKPAQNVVAGVVARLYWLVVGHAMLAILGMNIWKSGGEWGTFTDIAFLANLGGLVAVRYLDIARLGGTTAQGDPATMAHWRRYSAIALAVWAVLFVVVHL